VINFIEKIKNYISTHKYNRKSSVESNFITNTSNSDYSDKIPTSPESDIPNNSLFGFKKPSINLVRNRNIELPESKKKIYKLNKYLNFIIENIEELINVLSKVYKKIKRKTHKTNILAPSDLKIVISVLQNRINKQC